MVIELARFSRTAGCLALCAALASANVTILGKPGSYATIQAAVDAAVDGDVLLVEPGTYTGFTIDDKALSVIALPGPAVNVNSACQVINLAFDRTVLLAGLKVTGQNSSYGTVPALELTSDAGHVRLQGCTFKGGLNTSDYGSLPGGHGVLATNNLRIVMTQCTLQGGGGGQPSGYPPKPGGDGLQSSSSGIALFDCTLKGGKGSEETYPSGGTGGNGFRIDGYGMFVSGCTISGGNGGGGDYIGCATGGDGGHGLLINGALAQVLDTTTQGGGGGNFGFCGPGGPGQAIFNNGGTLVQIPGTARKLTGPTETSDNSGAQFVFTGQPGDRVWLLHSSQPGFIFIPALHAAVAVPVPFKVNVTSAGTIGASGSLIALLSIGNLVGRQSGWIWFLQGLCIQPDGQAYLTSPLQLLVHNT